MRSKEPGISVIVPVYNVEAYIGKCLDSLAAQTWTRMEVIAVDDASTDESGRICDAYAARDPRFAVVHLPHNGGLSAARNAGVCRAAGEYVSFVDGDDTVEPDLLEKLYGSLEASGADISVCAAHGIDGAARVPELLSQRDVSECLARRSPFLWTVWGKLYPAELVRRHPFDRRAVCCEDLVFFYQVLREISTVSYVPDRLYQYILRQGSAVHGRFDDKRCTVLSALDRICEDAAISCPQVERAFRQVALDAGARLAMQAVEEGMERERLLAYLERFQKHMRRHFSWRALWLASDARGIAAELLLAGSRTAFRGAAAFYHRAKTWMAGKAGRTQ